MLVDGSLLCEEIMTEKMTLALTKGRILKETLPLLAKAGIEPLDSTIKWNLHSTRPNNHPIRRLAAAASLFSGDETLINHIDGIESGNCGKTWIKAIFKTVEDLCRWEFWNKRLLFTSQPKSENDYSLIGKKRLSATLTNVIIPFYAAEKSVPLNTFKNLPAEDISSPMRTAAYYLLGRDHNPALYSGNNILQQGLLQIYTK